MGRSRTERFKKWSESEASEEASDPPRGEQPESGNDVTDDIPDRQQGHVRDVSPVAESQRRDDAVSVNNQRMTDFDDEHESMTVRSSVSDAVATPDPLGRYKRARALLVDLFGPSIEEEPEPEEPDLVEVGTITSVSNKPKSFCNLLKRHLVTSQNLKTMDSILETTTSQKSTTTLKYSSGYVHPKYEAYDNIVSLKLPASALPDDPIPFPPVTTSIGPIAQSPFCETVVKSATAIASSTNHIQWFAHATSKKLQSVVNGDGFADLPADVKDSILEACAFHEETWFSVLNLSRQTAALEANCILEKRDRQMSKWRQDIPSHVFRMARCAKVSGPTLFNGAVAGVAATVDKIISTKSRNQIIVTAAAAATKTKANPKPKSKSVPKGDTYSYQGKSKGSNARGGGKAGGNRGRGNRRGGSNSSRGTGPKGSGSKRQP